MGLGVPSPHSSWRDMEQGWHIASEDRKNDTPMPAHSDLACHLLCTKHSNIESQRKCQNKRIKINQSVFPAIWDGPGPEPPTTTTVGAGAAGAAGEGVEEEAEGAVAGAAAANEASAMR